MAHLSFENPVFLSYAIAAALMVLKVMGQGWMTVYRMMKSGAGMVTPEDLRPTPLNRSPRPGQLDPDDYVDRSRRMHRNDLENVPAFWVAGLLLVLSGPPLWLANLLFFGFVVARLGHGWAYLAARNHEVRATFYTIGSVIVIFMALWVLVCALA
ncbi:MAPEG family protein [Roseovarius salis]|uniref:MAPEG family protein n=1 Tax=Roseovarius salis TaxID=3376063 RepID=UPI0037CB7536